MGQRKVTEEKQKNVHSLASQPSVAPSSPWKCCTESVKGGKTNFHK